MRTIPVWDLPTRLFHWLLVASFVGAFLTGDSERHRDLHVLFGVTLVALIAFRVAWGVVGTRYARFRSFAFGPRAVLRDLRSIATMRPVRHVGHTPAGAWAIWLMLGLGVLVAAAGYGAHQGAEWLEEAHSALAWTLLAVVIAHVTGVLLSSLLHRENLVLAMVTGRKRGRPSEGIRGSRWIVAVGLAALVAALWLDVVRVPGPGLRPGPAPALRAADAAHEDDD
jgi:cytochrome b